jgi:hypothetical protein
MRCSVCKKRFDGDKDLEKIAVKYNDERPVCGKYACLRRIGLWS